MIKAVFFDLDGTLLPLNEDEFIKLYFGLLCKKMAPLGYIPEELVKVIWDGTKAMYMNDGSKTNEEVFWSVFEKYYGSEKLKDKQYLDDFYTNEFKLTKQGCEENPYVLDIIKYCHANNLKVILSTNPIFPKVGTLTRMSFINLKEEDFEYITTYENSNFSKPNPKYFQMLLDKFNLKSDEVILFGNNTYEDGECSLACGIKCYMVGDYVINHPKANHNFEHIKMQDVIITIKKILK